MARRFEDLVVWSEARVLVRQIYRVSDAPSFHRDLELRGQIRRAAVSVMSNIAEGFERDSAAQFRQFLKIAKASCGEVRSQAYVALDLAYLSADSFDAIVAAATQLSRRIHRLHQSIK